MSELLNRQLMFGSEVALLLEQAKLREFKFKLGEAHRPPAQAALNALSRVQRMRVAALLQPEFPLLARAVLDIPGDKAGIARSVHGDACALDLLLFTNVEEPEYLSDPIWYADLGAWWKSRSPLHCWGGDFKDSNHFSVTPDGVRK